jgi:GxxExxY protein
VHYDGFLVGDYVADMVVNEEIVVELKAVKSFEDSHLAQCLNYLKATGKRLALLINFGNPKTQIKRVIADF